MDCQFFRANQDALKEKILLQSDIYLESLRHCEGEYSYQDCDMFSAVDLDMFVLIILALSTDLSLCILYDWNHYAE